MAPPPGARIAVVGGCGGYGRPLVGALAGAGCLVAVFDLATSLARFPPDAAALTFPLDVRNPQPVEDAFHDLSEAWSNLDGLVYLTGYTIVPPGPLETVSNDAWDDIHAGNLRGAWLCIKAALPLLRLGSSAAIVTASSGLGFNLLPGFAAYSAAKAGLAALTKAVATENAPAIRANAVAPSASLTPFMGGGMGRGGEDGGDAWFGTGDVPMPPLGRLCEPDDVLGPILFLLGPASRFMTGQVLHVNGGRFTP